MKKSFVLYLDQYEPIKDLTDEQKGRLLDAMFNYHNNNNFELSDPVIRMAFSFFKETFKRDRDKYLKRCNKNRENVLKRWNTNNTVVYDGIRSDTKHTDSDSDSESESDIKDIPDSEESGDFYITKKKRKLTGKRLDAFNRFWEVFDFKKGKADAADSWFDIPILTETLVNDILTAAKAESENRKSLINNGGSPKWAQGWLHSRRWEDELQSSFKTTLTKCDLPEI